MTRLALLLLTSCTAMGIAQQRDAAVTALAAELVCMVEDGSNGPAWYSPADHCVHYSTAQAEAIVSRYGWGAVLGLYGHEIGHGIEYRAGRDYSDERAADRWAGCALARNGEGTRSTERFLADYNPGPPVYETTDVRVRDTRSGFNRCTSDAH